MAKMRPKFDWTRHPPPSTLTPFQQFTRNVDWNKSPLGPMASWPNQLRQMVLLVMADPNPAVVYWGEEQAIVYNEAYVPLIGHKHPGLQGQNPRYGGFAEIWDHFDNVLKVCERTGETHVAARSMLLLHRYGFLEETYFSWKFTPIICEDGWVIASHATVVENTREVINDRRMLCLQDMSNSIADATALGQFWPVFLKGLEANDKDVPLALVYSARDGEQCILEGSFGVDSNLLGLPTELRLSRSDHQIAGVVQKALKAPSPLLVKVEDGGFPGELFHGIEWKGFGIPSSQYVLCPIRAGGLAAVLILGLNPRRPWDSDYQQFIGLIMAQLVSPHVRNLALAADISAQKVKAEQASRDQAVLSRQLRDKTKQFEEGMRFTRFADRAPVGLCVTDVSGSILYANHAWAEFTGIDPEKAMVSTWADAVIDEDQQLTRDWLHRMAHERESGTFQIRTKQPFEAVSDAGLLMKADYKTGICASYADYDDNHNLKTVMGVTVDISELVWIQNQFRQRTVELEQSELKYRRFAEHAPVGVCRLDQNGLIDFSNDAWSTIFKQQQNNENGVPWIEGIHLDDLQAFKAFLADIRNLKAPRPIECRLKRRYAAFDRPGADQPFVWILASGHAEVDADGTVESVVCWITEISAQKAAVKVLDDKVKEATRLQRQQESFMDMVSHEIRNPLSAVLHCAEEISQSLTQVLTFSEHASIDTSKRQVQGAVEAAKTIIYCVQHQRRLVDDVLTLSKLGADFINVSPSPVQPVLLVQQALSIFENELKKADISLTVKHTRSLADLDMEWLWLDPNRFTQVLINLITNAIKFTRSCDIREISVKVCITKDSPSLGSHSMEYLPRINNHSEVEQPHDGYLVVEVQDSGIGMQENEKKALFQQFTQASPKTSIKYGGTGLGLFISRQITEMMGGEIGFSSTFGSGSTFAFFVKARHVKDPPQTLTGDKTQYVGLTDVIKYVSDTSIAPDQESHSNPRETPMKTASTTIEKRESSIAHILVLEDNLINQQVLCRQLRNRGHVVKSANHGAEGLAALRPADSSSSASVASLSEAVTRTMTASPIPLQSFDVVLCDIEMPVMNGIEFVREVRKLETQGLLQGHMPIMAVTANARSGQVERAIEAGMDGVTTKPYRMTELLAEMNRIRLANGERIST